MRMKFKALLMATVVSIASLSAEAENRWAVLIGASDYASDESGASRNWTSLEGPRNDVSLMYSTLKADGISSGNIRVLADTLERSAYDIRPVSHGLPVRDEILKSLDWLLQETAEGDQVLIYYSGHGAFVPEREDKEGGLTEDDGLDEILVPLGAGLWDRETESVPGQILDDELGERVRAILDKGVFVWLVVDACHSGTVVRSAGETDTVARRLDPVQDLGVPQDAIDAARWRAASATQTRSSGVSTRQSTFETLSNRGAGFVAFYAAPPALEAIEKPVPKGAALAERRRHGVMTWNLVQALRSSGATDYATLARQVRAGSWEWGAEVPLPQFEGDLRTSPMIGAGEEKFWGITSRAGQVLLEAGQLENIGSGSVLAVYQKGSTSGEPLFFARIADAGIEEATITVLPGTEERPSHIEERRVREGFKSIDAWLEQSAESLLAKVIDRVPAFVLSVAIAGDPEDSGEISAALGEALAQLDAEGAPPAIELAPSSDEADVLLTITDGRIWFNPPGAELVTEGQGQAYSLARAEASGENLLAALHQIARARNLTRTASAYSQTPTARALSISVHLREGQALEGSKCEAAPKDPVSLPDDTRIVADAENPLVAPFMVGHCNQVFYTLRNNGSQLLDMTPLHIDPWSQVRFMNAYGEADFGALRLAPGQTRIIGYTENTASSADQVSPVGASQIIWVVTEGDPDRIYSPDFRHLAGGLPESQRRDAGAPAGLRALLDGAVSGRVRSAEGDPIGRSGVIGILFETLAPEAASR